MVNRSLFRNVVDVAVCAALVGLASSGAHAASFITDRGGLHGFGESAVPPGDDGSSGAIDVAPLFPGGICLFGNVHRALFVNTNGTVSFTGPVDAFTEASMPVSAFPLMAPLWSDVDTRDDPEGSVFYDVDARAFVATWWHVGRYDHQTDLRNDVQLVIENVTSSRDYDIVFRYGAVEWLSARSSAGLRGVPAQVGFDAGDGRHSVDIALTQTQALRDLPSRGSGDVAGELRFAVRNCVLPVCGNGVVDAGEGCDDHNRTDGDGCSALCSVEPSVGEGEGEGEGDVVVIPVEGEGEGEVIGEGEGEVVGEGEGDVVGEGEGEGEGDVVGEGEGDVVVGEVHAAEDEGRDLLVHGGDGRGLGGGGLIGSCSEVGGGTAASALVLLLLLRRRRTALFALVLLALPTRAAPSVGLERFRPSLDSGGILDVDDGDVGAAMSMSATVWGGVEQNPLVLRQNGLRAAPIISTRVHGNLTASVALTDWLAIAVDQPIVFFQAAGEFSDGDAFAATGGFVGGGDLRFVPRVQLMTREEFGVDVAGAVSLSAPSFAVENSWVTDRTFGAAPELDVSTTLGPVRVASDVGWRWRRNQRVLDLDVGSEFFSRSGVAVSFDNFGVPATALASVSAAWRPQPLTRSSLNEAPAEAAVGVAFRIAKGVELTGTGGVGLLGGWGTPDWRAGFALRLFGDPDVAREDGVVVEKIDPTTTEPAPPPPKEPEPVAPPPEPTPEPAPPVVEDWVPDEVHIEQERLVIPDQIHFRRGYAFIEERSFPLLEQIARVLAAHPEVKKVMIEGHTDGFGPENINRWLSEQRALAVRNALVSLGVSASRLEVAAWSDQKPLSSDPLEARNRRVELRVEIDATTPTTP